MTVNGFNFPENIAIFVHTFEIKNPTLSEKIPKYEKYKCEKGRFSVEHLNVMSFTCHRREDKLQGK